MRRVLIGILVLGAGVALILTTTVCGSSIGIDGPGGPGRWGSMRWGIDTWGP